MAVIDSLKNGIQVVELIAQEGAPMTMAALIEKCQVFEMSEASTRNTIETLVGCGWIVRYPGKGNSLEYGLGEHVAKLWPIYLGRKLGQIEAIQAQTSVMIEQTKRMLEAM